MLCALAARSAGVTEIADARNDYNLNLPRYIDGQKLEDRQDIEGHLRGGIPQADMLPDAKKPLSIFEFPMTTWADFCVIKLLADMAEILQVADLATCSYHPLRNLARMTANGALTAMGGIVGNGTWTASWLGP